MTEPTGDIRGSASALAKAGFRVFPIYEPVRTGCSCAKRKCGNTGKHPRTRNGFKDATRDLATIDGWWTRWPSANVGIRTGDGLVVIDIDGQRGEEAIATFDLPATVEAQTGKGRHLYYVGDTGSPTDLLPGVDLRAAGSCVVAPPSRHASGRSYEWVSAPSECDMAPLPDWVYDALDDRARRPTASLPDTDGRIVEGKRNVALFQFACLVGSRGLAEREIAGAVAARNLALCDPPLDTAEVERIAASAASNRGVYLPDSDVLAAGVAPSALAVYLAIRSTANHQGICIASAEQLADRSGVGRKTVLCRAVPDLENAGLIHVERPKVTAAGPLRANRYTLFDPNEETLHNTEEDPTPRSTR